VDANSPEKFSLKFPRAPQRGDHFKLDVFKRMGEARMVEPLPERLPGVSRYNMRVTLDDGKDCSVTLQVTSDQPQQQHQPQQQQQQQSTLRPVSPTVPGLVPSTEVAEMSDKPAPESSGTASRRHRLALEARHYLDEHNLLSWTQVLFQDLIRERPADPWSFINEQTKYASLMAKKQESKEPVSVRTQKFYKLAEDMDLVTRKLDQQLRGLDGEPVPAAGEGTPTNRPTLRRMDTDQQMQVVSITEEMRALRKALKDRQQQLEELEAPRDKPQVFFSMTMKHLDYNALVADPVVLGGFEHKVKYAVACEAGVMPRHIQLALHAGSVIVRCHILPPEGLEACSVSSKLSSSLSLGDTVARHVGAVEGIEDVSRGRPITVDKITKPKVITPESPEAWVPPALTAMPLNRHGVLPPVDAKSVRPPALEASSLDSTPKKRSSKATLPAVEFSTPTARDMLLSSPARLASLLPVKEGQPCFFVDEETMPQKEKDEVLEKAVPEDPARDASPGPEQQEQEKEETQAPIVEKTAPTEVPQQEPPQDQKNLVEEKDEEEAQAPILEKALPAEESQQELPQEQKNLVEEKDEEETQAPILEKTVPTEEYQQEPPQEQKNLVEEKDEEEAQAPILEKALPAEESQQELPREQKNLVEEKDEEETQVPILEKTVPTEESQQEPPQEQKNLVEEETQAPILEKNCVDRRVSTETSTGPKELGRGQSNRGHICSGGNPAKRRAWSGEPKH